MGGGRTGRFVVRGDDVVVVLLVRGEDIVVVEGAATAEEGTRRLGMSVVGTVSAGDCLGGKA